jgi:hypothetical protein
MPAMVETMAARQARILRAAIQQKAAALGYSRSSDIPEDMTFIQWCEDLGRKGLKVDGKPFTLEDRPALRPIYEAIPTTREEAHDWTLVVMKATQLGLTIWEVLADLYMAIKFGPVTIGLFLPDQATATFKSQQRFMRIVRSDPALYDRLIHRAEEELGRSRRKIGEGNVLTREYAGSLLLFLWTSGRVTTESRPMDILSLDEVQEMALDDIDKARARLGDSMVRFTLMLSTANLPNMDIDFWYQQGTREVWHSLCEACGVESDLSDPIHFPGRVTAYNEGQIAGAPRDDFVWTCPACSAWIKNPQRGRYIAQAPDRARNRIRSFLIPRTISPRITPRQIVTDFARAKTGDQRKSFWNRTLARPYIDPDQVPVTLAKLEAAAAEGQAMGLKWLTQGRGCYMGVDQMGGWNAIIIKRRLPDGRQAVVHVEAIHSDDPFEGTADLMRRYGVAYCVVEQLPNVNDARRFANQFPGRVFLAGYADLRDDMMVWGDDLSRSDRRTAAEDRTRYTVTLNQFKAMQAALFRLREARCLWPDPDALEQSIPEGGVPQRRLIVRDVVWTHFTKTALVVDQHPETRKPVARVKKLDLDPHFSYANMLCDIAWSRDAGGTTFIPPAGMEPPRVVEQPQAGRVLDDPSMPAGVRALVTPPPPGTCGACASFTDGMCSARRLRVRADDPECPLYIPADDPMS